MGDDSKLEVGSSENSFDEKTEAMMFSDCFIGLQQQQVYE
jgi:hypothetical protein